MASKKLFSLLVLCLLIYLTECGRSGGRSSGRSSSSSRGGSSWGKGWGGSSSSSGSSWGSSGSSYKPSSSWSTGSSSGSSSWGSSYKPSSSHSYPSSSSGLSGSSSSSGFDFSWNKPSSSLGSHSYPSSSTGLSGSSSSGGYKPSYGSGSHSYPSSSTGLSGSSSSGGYKPSYGSGSHSYPSSSTGLSGSGSGSHSYPSSNGWSGSGSKYPSSSGTHSYPSSPGLSGSGSSYNRPSNGYNRPSNSYNTNSGYHGSYQTHYVPTYYSAPQHVYVTQYRDSSSRYSDLLTGLTLYNMGRTHSHYHDHYYYDDYYRQRYNPVGSSNSYQQESSYKASSEATCTLRIKENGKLEVLKIPCEIVSTFTEGSKKIENEKQVNHTVCTTNTTVTKTNPTTNLPIIMESASDTTALLPTANVTVASLIANFIANVTNVPSAVVTNASTPAITLSPSTTVTEPPIVSKTNKTDGNVFTQTIKTQTATETIVNVTVCTTQSYIDPLSVKGAKLDDASNMECAIDIRTADSHFRNTVECKTLMEYSKMSAPAKAQKPLLPPREKLKSWIEKPPWWMSLFIAV